MKKRISLFGINPIEELDLQHQGSVGGEQLASIISRNVQSIQSDLTPGREPAEGPDVTMTSPSHEPLQQKSSERPPTEGEEQPKSGKVHHYK